MSTGRRIAVVALGVLAVVLFLVVMVLFVVTSTDWGRERTRRVALEQLRAAVNGQVEIARVEGHLLDQVRLVGVSIVDEQGRPFVRAETLATRYSLRGLFKRRIRLRDVHLVRGEVVLDQPPGGDWNFVRIFSRDGPADPSPSAWGDWVELHDITLVNTRITVRTAWEPPPDLSPNEEREAIRAALSGETREHVVEVGEGFQNLMDFRAIDAEIARVLVAHPDTAALPIDITSLSGIAQPFRPPAARIQDLAGNFRLRADTLFFHNVDARLPGSRLSGEGSYALEHADLVLRLEGSPVALDDLRWLYPSLPEEGGGRLAVDVRLRPMSRRIRAREMDLRIRDSELRGRLDIVLGDTILLQDTDLQFERFDTRLISELAPDLNLPRHGRLTGSIAVDGAPEDLEIDADVLFADYAGGESRVLADGRVETAGSVRFRVLDVQFRPLQAELVRAFAPEVPLRGTIEGSSRISGGLDDRLQVTTDLALRDPSVGISRVTATGGLIFGKSLHLDDLRTRLDPLRLDLLRPYAPDLPSGVTASGPLRLDGSLGGLLQIDGDLSVHEPSSGLSRVAAHGGIDLSGDLRLRDLSIEVDPLQAALVRAIVPDFPLGGTLEGVARLNGAPASRLDFVADLVHLEDGERSHVTGSGEVGLRGDPRFDVSLALRPLSLNTLARYVPEAGLTGAADGTLEVAGTVRDLDIDANLALGDGGALHAAGTLGLGGEVPVYDLRLSLERFNPSAVSTRVPMETSLDGIIAAKGRGLSPATMTTSFDADLDGAAVDGYEADSVHVRLRIDRGMATLAPATVRVRTAEAEIDGTFGLVSGRTGTLRYRVTVDSLDTFAPFVPADTGVVTPRRAVREAALSASRDRAQDADIEFLATGQRPLPERDTLAALTIRRDSLGGRLEAAGTLRGNVEEFDADGDVELERFVYRGNYVESGTISFTVNDVGREEMDADLEASLTSLLVGGHAFEAATVEAEYRGGRYGEGALEVVVERDETHDLRLDTEFAITLERNELRLLGMDLRLDTLAWRATGPAMVYWGGEGVTLERVELESNQGGRIFLDGELPVEGAADLEVVVTDFEIGAIASLLQNHRRTSGRLSLDARLTGTRNDPRLEGNARLVEATFEGVAVPDATAAFSYAAEELRAEAVLFGDDGALATSEASIPIDLSFGDGGPRLLDRPMQIELQAERLPLDAFPAFTDQVEAVEGTIDLQLSLGGTPLQPRAEGEVALDLASLRFVPLGVRFEPVVGRARLVENVLEIDSLIAYSDGPARVTGTVRLSPLTNPVFDLAVETRETWVISTDDARLQVDADLEVVGPFDSLAVSGTVRTRRGVIYIPETSEFGPTEIVDLDDPGLTDRVDSLLLAQRDLVTRRSAVLENIQAEVEVEIDRDVWLRSTETNVEIYTPTDVGPLRIRMRGLQDIPIIEGTINTDRGEYEYLSRRFTLTRGSVTFLGGEEIDPLLQLAAEHEVRLPGREALTIRIVVGGTLRDLQVTLESNAQPPISQSDLLSFLAFGREASTLIQGQGSSISGQSSGGGGLVGNVAGIASQQFTAIALGSMISGIEADLGRDLGLDVIRITPAHMSADVFTGSYLDVLRGTEIEVGRYVGSRLFIAAQARPTRSLPGLLFEYRTRRDFEWTASWRSRFIADTPTLRDRDPRRAGIFGSFLFKEWRF